MERDRYIKTALEEHLTDAKTYQQLTEVSANNLVAVIKKVVTKTANNLRKENSVSNAEYLLQ